jgi:hypothetical protein
VKPTSAAALACHPETATEAVHGIKARVCWTPEGALALTYVLTGDFTRLRVSPPGAPRRADRLWEHTCFEAFVSVNDKPAYYEFNFSPSGEWAAYSFRSYRDGGAAAAQDLEPTITALALGDALELDAIIHLDHLPELHAAALRLALAAVIEEADGSISYWALKHPPGKPDFHHLDGFALAIAQPDSKTVHASTLAKR